MKRETRTLGTLVFVEGGLTTLQIPRDTFFTKFMFRLKGSVVTTFASGTPIGAQTSILDNLISNITVAINGSQTIKSVRPYLIRMSNFFKATVPPKRCSSAGAAAVSPLDDNTVEAGFTFGTTGQTTSFTEQLDLDFEIPKEFCSDGLTTVLRTKNVQTAEMRVQFMPLVNLQGEITLAPVVYTNPNIQIIVTAECIADLDPAVYGNFDYVQTFNKETFTAQQSEKEIEINKSSLLIGVGLLTESNVNRTASVEAYRKLSNKVLTNIRFKYNGNNEVLNTNFKSLQDANISKYNLYAKYVANVSEIDGYVYADFLTDKFTGGALDLRKADTFKMVVATNAPIATTLTYPVDLTYQTDEIRQVNADRFRY